MTLGKPMFKKLIIATAISASLTSLYSHAEVLSHSISTDFTTPAPFKGKQFIVTLKTNVPKDIKTAQLHANQPIQFNGKSKVKFKRKLASGALLVNAENFTSIKALMSDLSLNGEVLSIEEDIIVTAQQMPNDHYAPSMYSIENSFRGINAIDAWDLSQGKNINVAVLDTGFTAHPDTDDRTINGYDMISYLSVSIDGDERDDDARDPGTGIGCEGKSSNWHGTHVAGIIGAGIDNNIGAVGIAPQANLIHVRVLGQCGAGYLSDVIDGIYWAAGKNIEGLPVNPNPADIINLSLGSSSACGNFQGAIDYARSQGAAVVVSAGNNNIDASNQSPANCDGVISVAASDNTGDKASYSNFSSYGGAVDITAPGSSIIATVNSGTSSPSYASYSFKSGTSMAAPQVSGVIALMLEKAPGLTPEQIENILKETADQFSTNTQCNTQSPICGSGLVNAKAAVIKAMSLVETEPTMLINNQAISISGLEKEQLSYQFIAPENAGNVTISIANGQGDADIYVKKDQAVSFDNYDCRPWLTGNNESCQLSGAGVYSILINGYNQFSDVSLIASYSTELPETGIELHNDVAQWNITGAYQEEIDFWADVPANAKGLWVQTWGGSGDADLWVKKGSLPTKEDNDCLASTSGNEETCTMSPDAGRYFIKVRGYDKFENVGLRILWTY